jgi:uncharacterized protein (DUF2237 family)
MPKSRDGARNVLGTPLETCGTDPVTEEFLVFSKERGNDLSTPRAGFAGLHAGDPWCLCAMRWLEAFHFGVAPPVLLSATHENTLQVVPLEALETHALDRHVDA